MTAIRWVAAVCVAVLAAGPAPAGDPAAGVKAAFEGYRKALLAKDGKAAAGLLSTATADQYQADRDLALTGDEAAVRKLPPVRKLMVLRMRHQMTAAQLKGLDGRGLIAHGVAEGWIDPGSVARIDLGEVTADGDTATAAALSRGKPTPVSFRFVKEGGGWRLDLRPLLELADKAFAKLAQDAGESEDEFILDLIQKVSGKKPAADVWKPLEPKR